MSVIFITGANRGIGLSLTQQYLKGNHKVYATYRDASSATELLSLAEHSSNLTCIQLEITDIRVERLNDISEDDADSECFAGDFPHRVLPSLAKHFVGSMSLQECFKVLWESINGKGSWRENPWVWVVEFKAVGIGESN